MKFTDFLRGCAVAVIGLAGMRLYGPLFENKPYNTEIGWFDVLIVMGFGAFYYFSRKDHAKEDSNP